MTDHERTVVVDYLTRVLHVLERHGEVLPPG